MANRLSQAQRAPIKAIYGSKLRKINEISSDTTKNLTEKKKKRRFVRLSKFFFVSLPPECLKLITELCIMKKTFFLLASLLMTVALNGQTYLDP